MKLEDKPAFPSKRTVKDPMTAYTSEVFVPGMTLREYYAGQILAGVATDKELYVEDAVKVASQMADALIAELERSGGEN